jgi:hypothetical protein
MSEIEGFFADLHPILICLFLHPTIGELYSANF